MSCEDIPSLLDLQNTKKHVDDFGRLMGTGEGDSTNEVTGQVRPTYNKVIKRVGFKPGSGDFTTGFTVMTGERDIAWYDPVSLNWYSYLGVIPTGGYPVAPGTNPVGSSDWKPTTDQTLRFQLSQVGGAGMVGASNGGTVQDSLSPGENKINVDHPPYNGNLGLAIDAATPGSTLILGNRDYNIVGKYNLSNLLTKQLKFYGSGMPLLAANKSRFVTGTGTVIQGSLVTAVDGIEVFNLGVDVGPYVVDTLATGVYQEGLVVSNEIHNDPFNFSKYSKDCHIGNIKVLLKDATSDPATAKHGVLLENLYGGSHGYIECIGGYHGFVYKSYGVQPKGPVVAYGQQGQAVIFKSDANSICGRYKNGNLVLGKDGFITQIGVITQAGVGSAWVDISAHVSLINIANRGFLNVLDSLSAYCSDFDILSLTSDGCVGVTLEIPQNAIRWHVGHHSIANTTYGIGVVAGAYQTQIEDGVVVNASQYKYVFNAEVTHGKLLCGGTGVADALTSVPVDRNIIKSTSGITNIVSTHDAKAIVVMKNGWSNTNVTAEQENNTFKIGGFATGGNSDHIATIENEAYRPKVRRDIPVVVENSDLSRTVAAAYITPSGEIRAYGGAAIGPSGGKIFLDTISWLIV